MIRVSFLSWLGSYCCPSLSFQLSGRRFASRSLFWCQLLWILPYCKSQLLGFCHFPVSIDNPSCFICGFLSSLLTRILFFKPRGLISSLVPILLPNSLPPSLVLPDGHGSVFTPLFFKVNPAQILDPNRQLSRNRNAANIKFIGFSRLGRWIPIAFKIDSFRPVYT